MTRDKVSSDLLCHNISRGELVRDVKGLITEGITTLTSCLLFLGRIEAHLMSLLDEYDTPPVSLYDIIVCLFGGV